VTEELHLQDHNRERLMDDLPQQFEVTDELRRAEHLFHNTNRNFLILGSAGTGTSVLLKRLVENAKKNLQVLANTGLAAIQVGDRTIHSFFGFDLGFQERSHLRLKPPGEQEENRHAPTEALMQS
jgi:hypothetical protein